MLDVKTFQLQSFLPLPSEEVLEPRLKRAQEKPHSRSGPGGEFNGWGRPPRAYERARVAPPRVAAARAPREEPPMPMTTSTSESAQILAAAALMRANSSLS